MEKTKHRMTTEWAACLCTNQSDWWSGRQKKPGAVSIYKFRLTNTLATLLGCWYRQDVPCKVATEFTANKVEHFCLRLFESRLLVCGLKPVCPFWPPTPDTNEAFSSTQITLRGYQLLFGTISCDPLRRFCHLKGWQIENPSGSASCEALRPACRVIFTTSTALTCTEQLPFVLIQHFTKLKQSAVGVTVHRS